MNFIQEANRIYLENPEHEVIAFISFPQIDDHTICIDHTFVDDSLRGQGVASMLMDEVIKHMKKNNYTALATCSYARNWFTKHPEYSSLYKEPMQ